MIDDREIEVTIEQMGRYSWMAKVTWGLLAQNYYACTRNRAIRKGMKAARRLEQRQQMMDEAEVVYRSNP